MKNLQQLIDANIVSQKTVEKMKFCGIKSEIQILEILIGDKYDEATKLQIEAEKIAQVRQNLLEESYK